MTEPTDLEVEALAKAMYDELWPGAAWDHDRYSVRVLMLSARMVLRREARLVEALEKDAMVFDIAKQPLNAARVREVLAAHRADTRPEPTLHEAVERLIGHINECGRLMDGKIVSDVNAALAREQERGGGR